MITRVWSDLEFFRETKFQSGMNVVIADQAEDSAETESTNGLGKTTLIRIIQFCLGSDLAKDKVLNHPDLRGVTFGIDFTFRGETYSVSRSTTEEGAEVQISAEFIEGLSVDVLSEGGHTKTISLEDWKRVLTLRFLKQRHADSKLGDLGSPSFREVSYYYMRIGKAAFAEPKQAFQGQKGRQKRLCASYLLGLNWQSQKTLDDHSEKRTQITQAINAVKTAEDNEGDSLGDMEAERVVLEEQIAAKRTEVEQFNVREDYTDLEQRLSEVDRELHDLINENHSDTRLLDHYRASADETPQGDAARPIEILREAGAIFKAEALKTIDEVSNFNDQIYRNRKAFLQNEILLLSRRTKQRSSEIVEFTRKKTDILQILSSSGALESLIQLQSSITEMIGELEGLKSRIEERKKFERKKDDLTREIADNRSLLKTDLDDRRDGVDEAVALFARYTAHLYGEPAKLAIDVKTAGYNFKITIDRESSEGVEQMVIFCFDLMIATLRARRAPRSRH